MNAPYRNSNPDPPITASLTPRVPVNGSVNSDEFDRPEFLGVGWAFPLSFDERGEIRLAGFREDVQQSIRIILGTSPGERVMRPDFGAGLRDLVFEPLSSTTRELVRLRVEEALTRWEQRINVQEVTVRAAGSTGDEPVGRLPRGGGVLLIEIRYVIRDTNTEENLVYPFYLEEGNAL